MDHRTPLKLHTCIAFEGMSYFVEDVIGQGSNAIVYKGWYPDQLNPQLRHHVLIKELFPFHPNRKIWRNGDNCIVVDTDAQDHWNTHKESFLAGNDVHLRLLADHPDMIGGNLNSFSANGTLYSILGYSGGRSLQAELNASTQDLRRCARLMLRLLDALEAFHKSGYLHLDISPDNIMLVGNGENERIFLIDFNSAHIIGSTEHTYLSCKPGYSAPEIEISNGIGIGFPADLYSVSAVFFRCLSGRTLTLEETLRSKAPDGKDSLCLKDMPETVVSMVSRILKKGLHTLPAKRYQSIGQMRQAFSELIDRIDCVGVTHWSLWENGKRSVDELIRINPSLRYLNETSKLYPIRLKKDEGSLSLSRYLEETLSPEGASSLIVANGGMGKTTLLLHTAMLHGKHYSPNTPAVFYISLNSWNGKDANYIQNQILMSLRFKQDMNNYDSANHALRQLLNQPLKTRTGDIPTVLLLLDGLNEVHGDTTVLVQEINELNKLAGVRIITTSRNELKALELQTAELIPLDVEDIEVALGRNALLISKKQEVIQLLRTPLILSIYIQTSEGGRQLDIETEADLMKAYMDSLLQKELKQLPEDSPEKWQIDVALNYVLPAIAAETKKKGHALTEQELLRIVENCRKTLRSPLLKKVFPQWIGHTHDIFAGLKTADSWFGTIIHNILYQKLGLLTKNKDNHYCIFHQQVSEFLASTYVDMAQQIKTKQFKTILICSIACIFISLCIAGFNFWNRYINELESSLGTPCDKYYSCFESVLQNSWEDTFASVQTYIQNPTVQNEKIAHVAIKKTASDIKSMLESWTFYEESSKRYDINSGQLKFNTFEENVLDYIGKPPENLVYLDKSYLAQSISQSDNSCSINDYIDILYVLDIMIKSIAKDPMCKPILSDYVLSVDEFIKQRWEMTEALYQLYYFDRDAAFDFHQADANTEALAEHVIHTLNLFPSYALTGIEERIDLFMESNIWIDYSELTFYLPSIPSGWEVPVWLPEDVNVSYLITDKETGEILEVTRASEVVPFAWHASCYEISNEDVVSYVETMICKGFPYAIYHGPTGYQAVIHLTDITLTITWSGDKTDLILTGTLY